MSLKIAILGTRGVPNHYGGFEHIAGHLSRGLVERGHQVTVYNSSRHPYKSSAWHGVRIIHCLDPEHYIGVAGQFIYDLNCIMDTRGRDYDIILMLGYTSSSVWKSLYPSNAITITNMDGLEWKRTKYSKPVQKFLKYAEKLAIHSGHFHVADSPVIKEYLDGEYGINTKYIAYGAELNPSIHEKHLVEYGLRKNDYFLLMARMEPENNIEMILDGFRKTKMQNKFVVIGNMGNHYGKHIRERYRADKRIIFLGAIFDDEKVQSLTAYCRLYFHGHSVGGTNPSLLDAMAIKAPIAAHDNPFNRSLLGDNAQLFKSQDEVCHLISVGRYRDLKCINNNYETIQNEFTWERITDQYEQYFIACFNSVHRTYPVKHEKSILYKG